MLGECDRRTKNVHKRHVFWSGVCLEQGEGCVWFYLLPNQGAMRKLLSTVRSVAESLQKLYDS